MSSEKSAKQSEKPLPKTGFFQKIIGKIDASMKVKADEQAKQSGCSGKDSKGNKCC